MKFENAPAFDADVRRLSKQEFDCFRQVVRTQFVPAAERWAADPSAAWPSVLRVKSVAGATGVLEMIWSFSGPDGRATFERTSIDGEQAVRWRRVGSPRIFKNP